MRRRGDDVTFTPHEWAVVRILRDGPAWTSRFTDPTRRRVAHRYTKALEREGLCTIDAAGHAELTAEGRRLLAPVDEPVETVDGGE